MYLYCTVNSVYIYYNVLWTWSDNCTQHVCVLSLVPYPLCLKITKKMVGVFLCDLKLNQGAVSVMLGKTRVSSI